PVRSCQRRGAAVDLVLDRQRENRSQFVFARARGRDVIFWQTARTNRQARPNVSLPTALVAGQPLTILVDSHERYPWSFTHRPSRRTYALDMSAEYSGPSSRCATTPYATMPALSFSMTTVGSSVWNHAHGSPESASRIDTRSDSTMPPGSSMTGSSSSVWAK